MRKIITLLLIVFFSTTSLANAVQILDPLDVNGHWQRTEVRCSLTTGEIYYSADSLNEADYIMFLTMENGLFWEASIPPSSNSSVDLCTYSGTIAIIEGNAFYKRLDDKCNYRWRGENSEESISLFFDKDNRLVERFMNRKCDENGLNGNGKGRLEWVYGPLYLS